MPRGRVRFVSAGFENLCSRWLCSLSGSGLGRPTGRNRWPGSRSEWVCSLKTGGRAFRVVDRAGLAFRGPVKSGFVPSIPVDCECLGAEEPGRTWLLSIQIGFVRSRALDSRLGTGGRRGRSRPEWVCLFYCRAGGFRLKVGLFGQKCRDGGPIGFRCAFQDGFVQPGMAAMRAPMPTLQFPGTKELERGRRLAGCGSAVKELRMDASSGCPIRPTGFEASRAKIMAHGLAGSRTGDLEVAESKRKI